MREAKRFPLVWLAATPSGLVREFARGSYEIPPGLVQEFARGSEATPSGLVREFARGSDAIPPGLVREFAKGWGLACSVWPEQFATVSP